MDPLLILVFSLILIAPTALFLGGFDHPFPELLSAGLTDVLSPIVGGLIAVYISSIVKSSSTPSSDTGAILFLSLMALVVGLSKRGQNLKRNRRVKEQVHDAVEDALSEEMSSSSSNVDAVIDEPKIPARDTDVL